MKEIIERAISHNISFWICLTIAIFLMIGAALTPPYFIIDSSIFVATGELWLFAALGSAVRAIDKGQNAKIKRGDTTVTIGDTNDDIDDNNDNPSKPRMDEDDDLPYKRKH